MDEARHRRVRQVRLAQPGARGDLVLPPVDRGHQGADERPDVPDHARRPRAGDAGAGEVGAAGTPAIGTPSGARPVSFPAASRYTSWLLSKSYSGWRWSFQRSREQG